MRTIGVVLGIVLAAAIATWPSLVSLAVIWRDIQDYEYGWPIAVIAGIWIVFAARRASGLTVKPSWIGSLMLTVSLFVWLLAWNANSQIGHQVLMPPVIWLAVLAAAGWPIARQLLAPVAFLYFSVPVWDYAVPLLQRMSVASTEMMLGFAGVPAIVREINVTIPAGTFQIVEGCSGKRYLMVTLAVAYLAAAVNRMNLFRAGIFLLASAALALLANWIRIVVVIYAGHASAMQHYLVAVEHKTFGNAIFVLLLLAVLLLARRIARIGGAVVEPAIALGRPAAAAVTTAWRLALPIALLAASVGLVELRSGRSPEPPVLGPLPFAAHTWQGPLPAETHWQPLFNAPAAERRASYRHRDGVVELYVNVYGVQRQGAELISYGNTLLAPGNWTRAWPPQAGTMTAEGAPTLAYFIVQGPDGGLWTIAYTYQVGGWLTPREPLVQVAYGLRSMLRPVPAGVVALASRCSVNCEGAQALVEAFWHEMSIPVRALWPEN